MLLTRKRLLHAVLPGAAVLAATQWAAPAARAQSDTQVVIDGARKTLADLRDDKEFGTAAQAMHRARAVLVVPRLIKGGFFVGGEGGEGVLMVQARDGTWSNPAFYAIGAGSFILAQRLPEFYTIAAIFGFAYGGTMPIYAVLIRHYFGQRIMGTVLGAAAMVSSLGMALGPAIGGWIFDHYRSYTGLYLGSLAMGVLAVLTALALPRVAPARAA